MQPIVALRPDRESFPVVDCVACGQRSLIWLDVAGDEDVRRCLACNAAVDEPAPRGVGARALRAMGYVFLDEKRRSASAAKSKSKCGPGGVRGCGTGGCSSGGSCGSGGGCSSGGCG